ncbi:SUMF1/EgtB/PvdO family nonheme iron enzyme, partial [Candidatus Chloroploca sp. M-50]
GSSKADPLAEEDEQPQHMLELPTYWIGKTEVTNVQFRPFVEGDGYTNRAYWDDAGWQWLNSLERDRPGCWDDRQWNGDNLPVVCVSWYETMAYCRWLSAQTGQEFRLPTEAEWEKAARGNDGQIFPWGDTWDVQLTNGAESGIGQTTMVGQYPGGASPYGALDMAGNAWEWTSSAYKEYPYNSGDGRDDLRRPAETTFVLRGGSWFDRNSFNFRTADRLFLSPNYYDIHRNVGFRLARNT